MAGEPFEKSRYILLFAMANAFNKYIFMHKSIADIVRQRALLSAIRKPMQMQIGNTP